MTKECFNQVKTLDKIFKIKNSLGDTVIAENERNYLEEHLKRFSEYSEESSHGSLRIIRISRMKRIKDLKRAKGNKQCVIDHPEFRNSVESFPFHTAEMEAKNVVNGNQGENCS